MGWIRRNLGGNYLFGTKGDAFESLDEIVGTDHIQGVNESGRNTDAKYTSDNSGKVKLGTKLKFESDPNGTNYQKLADPKDYRGLLDALGKLYGIYGKYREFAQEKREVTKTDAKSVYTLLDSNRKPRAKISVTIDRANGDTEIVYEQVGQPQKEKAVLEDINRIAEVLERNAHLFA